MKPILLFLLISLFSIDFTIGWRFFGRGSGYNAFGGYTASRYYGGQFPTYNQPFYPRYQQPYMNGPYSNSFTYPNNYRSWQRNGAGFYGPESYQFRNFGSRDTQGFSPYDFYGNYGK